MLDAAEGMQHGGEAIGGRVLVVGAGLTGAELAWALAPAPDRIR